MRGRLYLMLFACLVIGILVGRRANLAAVLSLLAVGICTVLLCAHFRPRYARTVATAIAFALVGILMMFLACLGARAGILPGLSARHANISVSGQVAGQVNQDAHGVSFFMSVYEVREGGRLWRTREKVLVRAEDLGGARHVVVQGKSASVRGRLSLPSVGDGWLIERGAACTLTAGRGMITAAPGPVDRATLLVNRVRLWMSSRYRRLFQPRLAGFIEGVTLSKLDGIEPEVLADLRNTGLSHVVAVSGLHVGSAAVIVLALLSAIGAGGRARYAGAGLMAFVVAGLAAFRPSAVRALVMACLGFGAAVLGREYDSLSGISLAGILIACSNPLSVFDAGFQFSFAAALGIILGARMVAAKGPRSGVRTLLAVSASAQLAVLPLVVIRGDGVPVTALAANIVAVPLVGPILLTSWSAAALSVPSAWLGRACARIPEALARLILWVSSVLSRMPRSGLHRGAFAAAALLLYALGLLALAVGARRGRPLFRPLVTIAVSVAILLAPLSPLPGSRAADRLTVLDVGEGDAILIQDKTGASILVDGGPDGRMVLEKLEERGVRRLDLVVSSHPHSDHVAGLVDVVRSIPVGRILDSGIADGRDTAYSEFLSAARRRGVARTTASEGQVIRVSSSTRLEVLHAVEAGEVPVESGEYDNLNDSSVVIMASICGSRALLAGDIEAGGQHEMLGLHPDLSCDVLKVPHQGAADAATRELVESCRPSVAIVSVGERNSYGHPSARCLELMREYGARLFRTDRDGDIELSFTGDRIGIKTGRIHRQ